jgi:glycosyltransferase involved in cell wall biosynthesis
MHVCMLLRDRFPPDERVRKEATALSAVGHDVTLLCGGEPLEPERERVGSVDVWRVDEPTGSGDALRRARYAATFVDAAWLAAVSEVAAERAIDAVHAHGLSLSKTGLRAGATHDAAVLVDVRENRVERVRNRRHSRGRGEALRSPTAVPGRLLTGPRRLARLESNVLPEADRVLVNCEEARARYLRERDLDPRSVAVVRDTTDSADVADVDAERAREPSRETDTGRDRDDAGGDAGRTPTGRAADASAAVGARALGLEFDPAPAFVVACFGPLARGRGLETLIEATARAADDAVNSRLVLVGEGSAEYVAELEALARRRLAGGRVTIVEPGPGQEPSQLDASDVCVLPEGPNPATETELPPELFAAMAASVPVLTTDAAPHRRIVDATDCGRVVPADDPGAMADALAALADPELADAFGANGRRAVEREYNWSRDGERLRRIYRGLAAERRPYRVTFY